MIKPMLAGKADLAKVKYPVLASPKLDGIRCLMVDYVATSRTGKPIPNKYIQECLEEFDGLDGELIVGDPTATDVYRKTNSACMTQDGQPDFTYYVFDIYSMEAPYIDRLNSLISLRKDVINDIENFYDMKYERKFMKYIKILECRAIQNEDELLSYEQECLDKGYEGIMIRSPDTLYKHGRSTVNSAEILKLKRFDDSEAEILEIVQKMHNANEATTNELGYTERSSHKDNMIPVNAMGAIKVRDIHSGIEFHIGTGFDDIDRQFFWDNRDNLLGLIVKYKHFTIGVKDLPRFPSYIGFRDIIDL